MIHEALPWTPLDGARTAALHAPLARAVEAWSRTWINGPGVSLGEGTIVPSSPAAPSLSSQWQSIGGLHLEGAARLFERMTVLALNAEMTMAAPTSMDQQILKGLQAQIARSLGEHLQQALDGEGLGGEPPPSPFHPHGGVQFPLLGPGGSPLAALAAPRALLARAQRKSRRAASQIRVEPVVAALAEQSARLDVVLGRASLTVAELRHLAPGDVLVLDTPLDGPITLASPSGGAAVGRAKLLREDDSLALVVQPRAS